MSFYVHEASACFTMPYKFFIDSEAAVTHTAYSAASSLTAAAFLRRIAVVE